MSLAVAAVGGGIAFGVGLSLFFGPSGTPPASPAKVAAAQSQAGQSQATPPQATPQSPAMPWPTAERRAAQTRQPLPGSKDVPPGILDDQGAPKEKPGADVAALTPETRTQTSGSPDNAQQPAWKRFAINVPLVPGRPMIGIVIDDLGMDIEGTKRAIKLPAPVTLAFLPYAPHVEVQAAKARAAGHELLVHVPMEPEAHLDSGPNTLKVDLSADEIRKRLDWALGRFKDYVGINNHMGSRFTSDTADMDVVLADVRERGLLFLDSRTSSHTVAYDQARALGVPAAARQVFLDDTRTHDAVMAQLQELEQRAVKDGHAIAIGHPHDVTLKALEEWLPTLQAKGIQLAPVSALVNDESGQ